MKHKEHLDRKKMRTLNFLSFLVGFSQAVFIYIMSDYFKLAAGTENIGPFYFISYLLLLLLLLNLHKLIRVFGRARILLSGLFLKVLVIAVLAGLTPAYPSIFFLGLYILFAGIEWVILDVILESFSMDVESGRIRGKHLTLINAGFILGPFISTRLLSHSGYFGVFAFLLFVSIFIFIFALLRLRSENGRFRRDLSAKEVISNVRKRKNVSRIYYVSFILEFFYALMIIYTPLHLLDLGLSWNQIGTVFTIMLLPFVFLQYPAGILADKKTGEKELLVFSIFIMAVSTFFVYFIQSKSVFIWAAVLFMTRIGAALVEILRDSYFYKRIDAQDVHLIDFFRTAMPVGYIAASVFSFVILSFLPLSSIFLFLAIAVVTAMPTAFRLEKNQPAGQ